MQLGEGEAVSHKSLIDSRGDLVSFDVSPPLELQQSLPGWQYPSYLYSRRWVRHQSGRKPKIYNDLSQNLK